MAIARVFNMDSDLNAGNSVGRSCVVCGRAVKAENKYSVWSNNFIEAVHPDDVAIVNAKNASGPCTLVPIGNNCAKKMPTEFLITN